jgi:hypothetical protein
MPTFGWTSRRYLTVDAKVWCPPLPLRGRHHTVTTRITAGDIPLTGCDIERDRRHSELTPRFWVRVEPWGAGTDVKRLRVMLVGPPGLDHLDSLTVRILR